MNSFATLPRARLRRGGGWSYVHGMRTLLSLGILALMVAGCRTSAPSNAPVPTPEPFTRVANPDTNTVQLQVAVRRLIPTRRDGPVIWLVGTTHVGEPEYYHALQQFLNS